MLKIPPWRVAAFVAVTMGAFALCACSAGSLGSSDSGGKVTLSLLVDNSDSSQKIAAGLVKDFQAKNPTITVDLQSRPQGGDGDNVVKTRLATGDMTDIFEYNSGSLFQAIKPQQNLTSIADQSYIGNLDKTFVSTVSAGGNVYGVLFGTATGGGILYNKKIYRQLNLQVPKTWADFMANSAKIKAAGIAPVIQTYGDTWTSQIITLADFHNVAAADPTFATDFTNNKAKFATTPAALLSFQRLQDIHDAGYLTKDFASTKLEDGVKAVANGTGAQYPVLSFAVGTMVGLVPDKTNDVGFFAVPGDDVATNGLTVWEPGGIYLPKTTKGAKLEAAKKFFAFVASKDGCDSTVKAFTPSGPLLVKGCTLPTDVPQAIKDMQPYFDSGANSPALEFLSPVKGPSLEQITVEVGSGITSAKAGAALYDKDVQKQAQQLGLPGW